jgi:hypothetical protein
MTVYLSEEKLKQLLSKAYEAGWCGVRELKESAVEDIFNEYRVEQLSVESSPSSQNVYFQVWGGGGGAGGTGYSSE